MDALSRIYCCGVVPVVVIDDENAAVPTARALLSGGVDVVEITLRTQAGINAISAIADSCPEICLGAGTVLTLDQAKNAVEAGAKFIVSPGLNIEMTSWCIRNNISIAPGCVTPTEITAALALGLNVLKFFPASIYGGVSAIKALSGPFGDVKFIPTGGISDKNLPAYIASPCVHAVGGSWLCSSTDITAGNFDKITGLCREARDVVNSCRANMGT